MKLFLDDIITTEEIINELDAHDIDPEEKAELIELVDEMLVHHALNIILNHLPKEHHVELVQLIVSDPSSTTLIEFIQSKTSVDITEHLKNQSVKLKQEIKNEIQKSKVQRY